MLKKQMVYCKKTLHTGHDGSINRGVFRSTAEEFFYCSFISTFSHRLTLFRRLINGAANVFLLSHRILPRLRDADYMVSLSTDIRMNTRS